MTTLTCLRCVALHRCLCTSACTNTCTNACNPPCAQAGSPVARRFSALGVCKLWSFSRWVPRAGAAATPATTPPHPALSALGPTLALGWPSAPPCVQAPSIPSSDSDSDSDDEDNVPLNERKTAMRRQRYDDEDSDAEKDAHWTGADESQRQEEEEDNDDDDSEGVGNNSAAKGGGAAAKGGGAAAKGGGAAAKGGGAAAKGGGAAAKGGTKVPKTSEELFEAQNFTYYDDYNWDYSECAWKWASETLPKPAFFGDKVCRHVAAPVARHVAALRPRLPLWAAKAMGCHGLPRRGWACSRVWAASRTWGGCPRTSFGRCATHQPR